MLIPLSALVGIVLCVAWMVLTLFHYNISFWLRIQFTRMLMGISGLSVRGVLGFIIFPAPLMLLLLGLIIVPLLGATPRIVLKVL